MPRTLTPKKTLKELREAAHLSQDQLAYKAGVSSTTIANWEQGRSVPMLDQFRRVCDVLGVRMEYVALQPWERLLRAHSLWFHLHAHRSETGWIARCNGIDFSERLDKDDPYYRLPKLSEPMDENDPESTTLLAPSTWKWEESGSSAEEAIQKLADRIVRALDRSDPDFR